MLSTIALRAVGALLFASLGVACTSPQHSPTTASESTDLQQARRPNTTPPQWNLPELGPTQVGAALVFVHGIFGDTLGTWSDERSGKRFYDMIASDPKFNRRIDIFMYGYPSSMFGHGSFSIQEAADTLFSQLQYNGAFRYQEVAFAAHSMGGLVVMEMLLTHQEIASKVRVLVFFSTPGEGANITEIARFLVKNPALEEMFPADKNLFLQELDDHWVHMGPSRPRVACAYEKLKTDGVLIVPWASATRFCDDGSTPVEANHINIVKPTATSSDAYQTLANALTAHVASITGNNCVIALTADSTLVTADSTITADSTVMRDPRCDVSAPAARAIAVENLRVASRNLEAIQSGKSNFFFPALQRYESAPTAANWRVVVDQERTIRQLIQDAVSSIAKIEPEVRQRMGQNLAHIDANLLQRSVTLSTLEDYSNPTVAQAKNIEATQRTLFQDLQTELNELINFATASAAR